jgi:DNA-binding Lrp family transcriptional regulator
VAPANGVSINERKSKMARAQLLHALSDDILMQLLMKPEDILMQVSTKPTAKEVWDSLKTRFVGADRVKAAHLATLKGEFDKLIMEDTEPLDDYANKISNEVCRSWRDPR